jgi:hypothetical protein
VDAPTTTGAEETDMQDLKASPLPIVMLRGWAYHEAPHRRTTSKTRRPRQSVVRRGVATIRRLLATAGG